MTFEEKLQLLLNTKKLAPLTLDDYVRDMKYKTDDPPTKEFQREGITSLFEIHLFASIFYKQSDLISIDWVQSLLC